MGARTGRARTSPRPLGRGTAYLRNFTGATPNARRLLFATACLWVGIGVFGVLFNLYLIALGYGVAFVGALGALSTVGQASVSPVLGGVMRRRPARTVMLLASAASAATMALSALFTGAIPLVVVTVLLGAGIAAASIPASPFIMEQSTSAERARLFSAYSGASALGALIGSLISGVLPGISGALPLLRGQALAQDRTGLLLGAAITAIGVWSLWRITDERVEDDSVVPPKGALDSGAGERDGTRGDVVAMMAATSAVALALGLVYPLFNVYFATVHHASTTTIGLLYAVSGAFCTAAALFGPLAARMGTLKGLVILRMFTAPILLIFWAQPVLAVAFVAYIGRNILGQVTGSLENTFAMEAVPMSLRAAAASWRSFAFNCGWTLGSLVAGVVVARFGFSSVFAASAMFTLAGALTWYWRFGWRRTPKEDDDA